jgi:hypothetical protein
LISEVRSLGKLGKISHNEAEAGGIGGFKDGEPVLESSTFKTIAEWETFLNRPVGD